MQLRTGASARGESAVDLRPGNRLTAPLSSSARRRFTSVAQAASTSSSTSVSRLSSNDSAIAARASPGSANFSFRICAASRFITRVRDEMNPNAARREELKAKLAAVDDAPPLLHPEMAASDSQHQRSCAIQSSCGSSRYGAKAISSRGDTPMDISYGRRGPKIPCVREVPPSTATDFSSPHPGLSVRCK